MSDVTRILERVTGGEARATDELLPLVYNELRALAAARLNREPSGQTLDATALVHEAYLRLVDVENGQQWDSRGHFFAAAAEAMRRIVVERARHKRASKYGGSHRRREFHDDVAVADSDVPSDELLALDEALSDLEKHEPQAANLVKMRYFAGLSHQQAAEALGVSRRVADRLWTLARAWLYRHVSGQ